MEPTSLQTSAEMMLDRQLDQVDVIGLPEAVERRVEAASPAAALVDASHHASMVVVGSRGHRPGTALVLGSVSDPVTHHASGPVIVVPQQPVAANTAEPTRRSPGHTRRGSQ
jgi:nucleotide-binding universal stress UspA family protein